jgi:heat shock protein HslJ
MKNSIFIAVFCVVFVLPLALIPLRASGAPAHEGGASFRDVAGKEWILEELKSDGKTIRMDRQALEAINLVGAYTISFQERDSGGGQVAGMGAPNRYIGPYTVGSNRALSLGNMASTMMMAIREPEGLREVEYYGFLSKVTRWDLREGKLELYSSNANGTEAVLIFIRV